ncbi:MAG: C39 family peptidase [Lachnospiraceae bacterium]|nr:C39 family peptidase [Lachnospiraceae bacterium]
MKRRIFAFLVVLLLVGVLSGGVSYMDTNEMTAGELLQIVTEELDRLVTSGEIGEKENLESEAAETQESEATETQESEATETQESEASGTGDAGESAEKAKIAVVRDFDDSSHLIENFEIICQMPELPTGCEIVAMTMVLNYYGFDVDKTIMASEYLPTAAASFYYGNDGLKYGPDLNAYFVGDPFSDAGYICGTEAILTAANGYLRDEKSTLTAVDLTGSSAEELYRMVSQDVPVVVWVTIGMEERYSTDGWYTEEGRYVEWSSNDHGAVLIGYTEDTVTIADPISGLVEYSREDFESVFASRGNQCVVLQG